jgi:peptide/nickel transport system substrate-binding protein
VKVYGAKAIIAGAAALALGLTACSGSSSGGGGTGAPTGGGNTTAGAPTGGASQSSNPVSSGPGTKGTGAFAQCASQANTCNSGSPASGSTLTYVLEKTIPGWNINLSTSNVFELAEVEDGILPQVYINTPDLKASLNTDLMVSAAQTKTNPQTLVYKINPKANWSDGKPIDFTDFKYLADVSDGKHCPKCGAASSSGYNDIKSMKSSDGGKTVTIVMSTPFADWQGMFAPLLPAHIAAQHGGTSGASSLQASFTWFDKNVPTYSGGPMKITGYTKDQSVTEVPNPAWYGKEKSPLKQLIFRIITDQTQEPTALQNHEVDALYPQPSADLVSNVSNIQGSQYYLGKGLNWEHLDFNEKNKFLSDKTLRTAIFTAISRDDIIRRTVGQFVEGVKPLNSRMYVPGQAGYTDNVSSSGQGSGNVDKAKQLLTSAGYTGVGSALKTKDGSAVTFRCTYSAGNTNRQQICEIVQATCKQLGINVTLKTTTDLSELGNGNYDMIVFAWTGTPFPVGGAQQIWELHGGADFGANNDPAAEKLINKAAVQTDTAKEATYLNQADKLLTNDAYVLPLFQKPTFLAAYTNVVNMRDDATSSGPPYNVQEWGLTQ